MKTILFDLYGTLVDIHTDESKKKLWKKLALYFGYHQALYKPKELKKAYLHLVDKYQKEIEEQTITSDAHETHCEIDLLKVFYDLYAKKGIWPDENLVRETALLFRTLSTSYIRLYPHAKELLKALKEAGYQIVLLSNAQAVFTRAELNYLQIADLFDAIYLSSDYSFKKPDIRFFEQSIEQNHIDTDKSIMVGNDMRCDIEGAKKAGLHTLYLHTNLSPLPHSLEAADAYLEPLNLEKAKEILLSFKFEPRNTESVKKDIHD